MSVQVTARVCAVLAGCCKIKIYNFSRGCGTLAAPDFCVNHRKMGVKMPEKTFQGLVKFLERKYETTSQAQIARKLNLKQPQISSYQGKAPESVKWWRGIIKRVYDLGYKDGQREANSKLMSAIINTFGKIPQADLAESLRMSQPAVSSWMRGSTQPRAHTVERMLSLYVARLVEPILEFEDIMPQKSGSSWRIHGKRQIEGKIRSKVQGKIGIYVFYDSAGKVTYLGKTEKCFWNEIRQRLKGKVNRPYYNPKKVTGVQQGEVARKISVYRVRVPAAIHNLEVLMLRAFPNDLANTNVGNFKKRLKR